MLVVPWIEWRRDGALLACATDNKAIKILDQRHGKIVKSFENFHDGKFFCQLEVMLIIYYEQSAGFTNSVKWNHNGNLLAFASSDGTMKVLNFDNGKIIYNLKTPDESNNFFLSLRSSFNLRLEGAYSVCFLNSYGSN